MPIDDAYHNALLQSISSGTYQIYVVVEAPPEGFKIIGGLKNGNDKDYLVILESV